MRKKKMVKEVSPFNFQFFTFGNSLAGKSASQTINKAYIAKAISEIGSTSISNGVGII